MTADVIARCGPFFATNAEPEVARLQQELAARGFPLIRAHRHKCWIIVEGWKVQPESMQDEPMPSREFVAALVAGELENWVSSDGYVVPERKEALDITEASLAGPSLPSCGHARPQTSMPSLSRRTVSERKS